MKSSKNVTPTNIYEIQSQIKDQMNSIQIQDEKTVWVKPYHNKV